MTISPTSGIKNVTQFSFQISPSSTTPVISWGDGTFSYSNTASHVYSSIGLYQVFSGSCSSTSSFYVSVYDGDFFTDKISVQANVASSIVSCPFSFTINLSSKDQTNTVILYASGSKSSPRQEKRNFWSHLNPEWEFSFNDKPISQIEIVGSPVYSGTNILGYSSSSAVSFKDDMPGNLNLFFTVLKKESDVPINSRVYSCLNHSVCAVAPDKLFITSDGINPLNSIQWADKNIPFVVSVGSSVNSCTNILHYVSGNLVDVKFLNDCYGFELSAFVYSTGQIKSFDNNCFPTAGYFLSSAYYPGSSLPTQYYVNNSNSCNTNNDKLEFLKVRNTPKNVTISAVGTFDYNGTTVTLTGQSNSFGLMAFENRHEFFRKGEDYTVYDVLKNSLPFDLSQYSNFDSYLSAVVGENDSFGLIYDKIHNFSMDHSDLETCSYDVLPNKALMLDSSINDFGLELPQELKRLFNFSTIPLQKLIGTRCVCNTNFVECDNCYATNVCKICKFDKRTNLGDVIKQEDYLSAGEIILYKEIGGQTYNFLPIKSQNSDVYQLKELSSLPVNYGSPTNYSYYRWNNSPQNNPIQSIVNYNDERNKLNPGLSSNNDWYGDNGIVEELFNFVLNKYLTN